MIVIVRYLEKEKNVHIGIARIDVIKENLNKMVEYNKWTEGEIG